ncbi:alcohol dehydrogenase catalytic domain-containing protein [Oceanobacter mangrovi]|uniref:alcohol dehydrogenase catalytic domain-containing protein n=1 Tax=Oceanobacter mangrovi TaxID=2862510 RepID=UPI001C8EF897|nr:zinc-binding dehydrogenase [Oceanobacter mangrovi]
MPLSKALLVKSTGAPDVLGLGQVDIPSPAVGQLLIKVVAAGFNPLDTKIRAGLAPLLSDSRTIGVEMAGEVVEVGEGVNGFAPGDQVFGLCGGVKQYWGACSEYTLADARWLARRPANISPEQAAGASVVGLTALEVMERFPVEPGMPIMVLGASGGVGRCVVQLALAAGMNVTGTAGSPERIDDLQQLGVQAISHAEVDSLIQNGTTFPCVVDTFGGTALQQALGLADFYGDVVTINARGEHQLALAHGKGLALNAVFSLIPILTGKGYDAYGIRLATLTRLLVEGKLLLPEPRVVAMAEAKSIHTEYEAGKLRDKVAFVW